MAAADVSAQGLFKTLDKIGETVKKIDTFLGNPTEQNCTTVGYETAKIKSFSPDVDFIIESCINDGKMLALNFTLNNRGRALKIGRLGGQKNVIMPKVDTRFTDDLGNAHSLTCISTDTEFGSSNNGCGFDLSEGAKVRGSIGIAKFDHKAKSLKSATIAGYVLDETKSGSDQYVQFEISLRDVPVYTSEQILGKDSILFRKDNPTVEGKGVSDCKIKSFVLTKNNTQVNFTYKGASLSVHSFDNTYILSGGTQYPLKTVYGIASSPMQEDYYPRSSPCDFTMVFEALPQTVEMLDLIFSSWRWEKVRLMDAPEATAAADATATADATAAGNAAAAASAAAKTTAPVAKFTLTKNGVACLKRGLACDAIPKTCEGLYDRYTVKFVADEYIGDYNEIIFYAGKEAVAMMYAPPSMDECTVGGAEIFSSNVSTPDGVYPGMLVSELIRIKGLDSDNAANLILNGYCIGVDFNDLTPLGKEVRQEAYDYGKTWRTFTGCFKKGAKVTSISYCGE